MRVSLYTGQKESNLKSHFIIAIDKYIPLDGGSPYISRHLNAHNTQTLVCHCPWFCLLPIYQLRCMNTDFHKG